MLGYKHFTGPARCTIKGQEPGASHPGGHPGMLAEDGAMFTITVQDRHGVWHTGRIRKLMPVECWRLQGFTDGQFYKAQATGLKDGRLYKMAGNAVSVPVISAIGQKIKEINGHYGIVE